MIASKRSRVLYCQAWFTTRNNSLPGRIIQRTRLCRRFCLPGRTAAWPLLDVTDQRVGRGPQQTGQFPLAIP